ncbi:MAG: hypothetical protein IJ748_01765 [Bacteroidales bacterium]|nr:hypothetical protein [Bacteroidales bacterium]
MEKTKHLVLATLLFFTVGVFAQKNHSYQPLTKKEQADIYQSIYNRNVSNFLISQSIPIGPVNLTDILNTVSYNPVEGTRIRLSAETNNMFSKRIGISLMGAYGTKDKDFKYAFGLAYNFAKKPKGVFAFPASTLALNYSDNTFIPSYENYDVAYFSFGEWDRFYFGKKREVTLSFLQDFKTGISVRPFVKYENIYSYMLYEDAEITHLLSHSEDLENYAGGVTLSFSPVKYKMNDMNIFNSRYYYFPTSAYITYKYNYQKYSGERKYNYLSVSAQHRFYFRPLALDLKISGGKIFGESYDYTYFSPNYRVSDVSNLFGFNLYSDREMRFKEYIQTFTQLNLGGLILDNIKFFKNFRPNEFINLKALFTADNNPYFEVGAGVDHILSFLGVEFVKRISSSNPMGMPKWGFKLRCNL